MGGVMRNDVRPYFVASEDSVQWGQWRLLDGAGGIPLPQYIEGWEPGTNIRISREFDIDRARFEAETRCSLDDCRIHLRWLSSTTGMAGSAPPIVLSEAGEGVIDVNLLGAEIAGTLSLYSRVVLAVRPRVEIPLGAAQTPGSVLNEHKQLLELEKPAAMFPIQMVDFARTPYPVEASWHLDIDGDLDSPFMGGVLLQVNARDTALREAISHNESVDDVGVALTDELESSVSALLIDLAIAHRDDLLQNEWPVDSIADVLKNTLLRADLEDTMPPAPRDLTDFRTRVGGAVRKMGHGRLFR